MKAAEADKMVAKGAEADKMATQGPKPEGEALYILQTLYSRWMTVVGPQTLANQRRWRREFRETRGQQLGWIESRLRA